MCSETAQATRPRLRQFGMDHAGSNPQSIRNVPKDAARASPPSLLRHLRPPPSSPWLQWDARRVTMVPSLIPAPPSGDQPQGTRMLSHIPPEKARGCRESPFFKGPAGSVPACSPPAHSDNRRLAPHISGAHYRRSASMRARRRGLSGERRRLASSSPSCSTLHPGHSRNAWYVQSQPYSPNTEMQSLR